MGLQRPLLSHGSTTFVVKGTPLDSQSGVQLTLDICRDPQAELSHCPNDPWRSVFIRGLLFVYLRSSAFICG
jgi:hypothetical protein